MKRLAEAVAHAIEITVVLGVITYFAFPVVYRLFPQFPKTEPITVRSTLEFFFFMLAVEILWPLGK
jgi:hypothetical protein